MEGFVQGIAGVLIAVIVCLTIRPHSKELATLLVIAVCVMTLFVAVCFLEPVIGLIRDLQDAAQLNDELLQIVLKAIGVGLIGEFVSQICADSGNSAMGKAAELLTAAVVLWLAIPMLQQLLQLVTGITDSI